MTIQVFTRNEIEEKALLDFLKSGHYTYKPANDNELAEPDLSVQYNKELDEADRQIDAGDHLSHEQVKRYLASKRNRL